MGGRWDALNFQSLFGCEAVPTSGLRRLSKVKTHHVTYFAQKTLYFQNISAKRVSKQRHKQFLALYQPVHDRFERFCRARAYADMPYEDLINETLLVAYKKWDSLKNPSSFLSFLIGISIRILANSRKKKRAVVSDDVRLFTQHPDPKNEIESQFEVAFLHHALSFLPEQQREALILFEITGFSIREIMDIQNSGESAVKQRLARGRKALAQIVKHQLTLTQGGER